MFTRTKLTEKVRIIPPNKKGDGIIKSTPLREIPEKPKNLEMDRTYNKIRK